MNWILFGFKGVGKTYYGSRLGLPFIDTDAWIEKREKKSIRDIVLEKGEEYFRQLEREAIKSLNPTNTVISVGGGAVLDHQNLTHLQQLGKMLYLKADKKKIKKQILTSPLPTFLDPQNPQKSFEEMYCTRKEKYETIPAVWIETDKKLEKQILEAIWQVINLDKFFGSPPGENLMAKPLV